jgi:hypothetical protein
MTIITGPRGSGRTTVLVQQFLADPFGVYCVPAQERKAYVWHIIRVVCEQSGNRLTTGVKEVLDRRILTASELPRHGCSSRSRIYIDDAELVLSLLLRHEIAAAVFPGGNEYRCTLRPARTN